MSNYVPKETICSVLSGILTLSGLDAASAATAAAETPTSRPPNFLWLDAEDASVHWFGCYGNPAARTPNIDRLAAEGFRYTHAFANAPVCSPSRSTWITGILAVSTGTVPLRSRDRIPHERINYYPDLLRAAGYYATNPGKTDYNIGGRPDRDCWDSGTNWNDRGEGQPFFHVEHFPESHESRAFGDVNNPTHDPALQRLRAYHPDIPRIRNNYAHYADAVERMDRRVGEVLARLEADGLAESTIVLFTTDHGGVMPGSKRFLNDCGTHAPFIIRIPEAFQHLWPAKQPGMTVDRLISFVDMPKTWLHIAGAEVPDYMQGRIFLGPEAEPERESHFAFTSRQAERYYEMRAVRTKQMLYIKNYKPYISTGQRMGYLWRMEATRAWEEHHLAGKTDDVTGAFFHSRQPVERLHDSQNDPDNVVNLVDHPEYRVTLESLRAKLREWQLATRDTGLLPEEMMSRRAATHHTTIYEMAQNPALYDLPAYLDASDLALSADPVNRDRFIKLLNAADEGLRYWGIVGLIMLHDLDEDDVRQLKARLVDDSHVVRAMAAWALLEAQREEENARNCLIDLLKGHSYATVLTLNVIDLTEVDVTPYLPAMEKALTCNFGFNYGDRMKAHLRAKAAK